MKSKTLAAFAAALTVGIFIGCQNTDPPQESQSSDAGINNSDPRKPNYIDVTSIPALKALMEEGIAKKKAARSGEGFPPNAALAKSATAYPIGFLNGWGSCSYGDDESSILMNDENDPYNGNQMYYKDWYDTDWTDGIVNSSTKYVPLLGNNSTYLTNGIKEPPQTGGYNTRFTICTQEFESLSPARVDYAVFRMGDYCPSGSYPFARVFDNEDGSNTNSYSGDIGPNVSSSGSSYTRLEFCFVPKNEETEAYPIWDEHYGYGVFAPAGLNPSPASTNYCKHWGWTITDDEDTDNSNEWIYYGMDEGYIDRIYDIFMNGTADTHLTWNWCEPYPVSP